MAELIKSNGERKSNIDISSLQKMQTIVGGYIEAVYLNEKKTIICNEEGLIFGLPYNAEASKLAGKQIVGDVIYCNRSELK